MKVFQLFQAALSCHTMEDWSMSGVHTLFWGKRFPGIQFLHAQGMCMVSRRASEHSSHRGTNRQRARGVSGTTMSALTSRFVQLRMLLFSVIMSLKHLFRYFSAPEVLSAAVLPAAILRKCLNTSLWQTPDLQARQFVRAFPLSCEVLYGLRLHSFHLQVGVGGVTFTKLKDAGLGTWKVIA